MVHTEFRRDFGEAVAVIAPNSIAIAILVGQKQVQITVLIHIKPAGADSAPWIRRAGAKAKSRKRAPIVSKEPVYTCPICSIEVEIAIIVIVDPIRLARKATRNCQLDSLSNFDKLSPVISIDVRPTWDGRDIRPGKEIEITVSGTMTVALDEK